jgi:hypothetical protein
MVRWRKRRWRKSKRNAEQATEPTTMSPEIEAVFANIDPMAIVAGHLQALITLEPERDPELTRARQAILAWYLETAPEASDAEIIMCTPKRLEEVNPR